MVMTFKGRWVPAFYWRITMWFYILSVILGLAVGAIFKKSNWSKKTRIILLVVVLILWDIIIFLYYF
jgi:hypothetical protein